MQTNKKNANNSTYTPQIVAECDIFKRKTRPRLLRRRTGFRDRSLLGKEFWADINRLAS